MENSDVADDATAPSIAISKSEYDELLAIARQYGRLFPKLHSGIPCLQLPLTTGSLYVAALRQNLIVGGVAEETIAFLSRTHDQPAAEPYQSYQSYPSSTAPAHQQSGPREPSGRFRTSLAVQATPQTRGAARNPAQSYGGPGGHSQEQLEWADGTPSPDETSLSIDLAVGPDPAYGGGGLAPARPQYDRVADRTLVFSSLPDGVTHGDITAVIRGGMLLDVFLRSHDRSATVSFLQGADAKAFYEHVRRHDLYIKSKRVKFSLWPALQSSGARLTREQVEVRWHDRQFLLPGHVANKIGIGATRNLVIRRCDAKHTEESVRDDLEHIHNLVVIRVTFADGNCCISTNSVHNAMFARTCMMSRAYVRTGHCLDFIC